MNKNCVGLPKVSFRLCLGWVSFYTNAIWISISIVKSISNRAVLFYAIPIWFGQSVEWVPWPLRDHNRIGDLSGYVPRSGGHEVFVRCVGWCEVAGRPHVQKFAVSLGLQKLYLLYQGIVSCHHQVKCLLLHCYYFHILNFYWFNNSIAKIVQTKDNNACFHCICAAYLLQR